MFSWLAIILYLSLLCTSQPGHAHDQWLEPDISSQQLQAVTGQNSHTVTVTINDSADSNSDPALLQKTPVARYFAISYSVLARRIPCQSSVQGISQPRGPPQYYV